jgi:hypothetical protein
MSSGNEENADVDDKGAGFIRALPLRIQFEHFEGSDVRLATNGFGVPNAVAIGGTTDGEPALVIVNESPTTWVRTAPAFDKRNLELLHLQRFAVDYRLATGSEAYLAIQPGGDPPDFVAEVGNGTTVGWELTAFTISERRNAQALFNALRRLLVVQQRHRVTHLAGFDTYVWFGRSSDSGGLPHRHNDTEAQQQLLEALINHRPDPNEFRTEGTSLPQQLDMTPVQTPQDAQFISVPMMGGAPLSLLFLSTGTEIHLAYQSSHTASITWSRLQQAIAKKDRPGNDNLLISVGAPDRNGMTYATEELLANFIMEHPRPVETRHLKNVILHFWSTGVAISLTNGCQPMWSPIYTGIQSGSLPFVPSPGQTANSEMTSE